MKSIWMCLQTGFTQIHTMNGEVRMPEYHYAISGVKGERNATNWRASSLTTRLVGTRMRARATDAIPFPRSSLAKSNPPKTWAFTIGAHHKIIYLA